MKIVRTFFVMCAGLMFAFVAASAHTHTISGGIITSDKSKIVGATVKVLNTMLGAKSDKRGEFRIMHIPDGKHVLQVSCIGYETQQIDWEVKHTDPANIVMPKIEMKESITQMKDVVVTATRSEKVYEDVPVKVSVLSNKIFENTASVTLREGLNFQPGLRVETNCQNCGFSQVRLNGLEGQYSQILIDGKAVYSALNGIYGLDQIPANMIDRVEVIRGGGSALYGGNAIAGVINIITKTPSSNFFSASTTQSFTDMSAPENVVQMNGAIVNDEQNLGIHMFGSSIFRKEWDANDDGFTEIGRLNVKTIGANMFYKPSYLSKISLEYHTLYHELRGGDSLKLPPHRSNITETTKHITNVLQLQYEQYINGTDDKFAIYASHQDTKRDSYYGSDHDLNAYGHTDNQSWAIGSQFNHVQNDFAGIHVLTIGYEYNNDKINDLAPVYNRKISQEVFTNGIYLQDDWEISKSLDFVFGARFDKHNLVEDWIVSPRANILYKPIQDLSLRACYSTGFRAPQAFDEDLHVTQVGGEGMVIQLSDDLKAEHSKSFSFSADYVLHIGELPIGLSLEYFNTKLTDAFVLTDAGTDESGNIIMMRENGGEGTVQGGTFEMEIDPSRDINLKLGGTLQSSLYSDEVVWSDGDPENGIAAQSSDKIMRTPNFYGFFTLNYFATKRLSLNLSGIYTGKMYVPHYAGGINESGEINQFDKLERSKAFMELNAKISYKVPFDPGFELYIGMQNLLNQFQDDFDRGVGRDAAYIYGPGRPRTIFCGIKFEG